MNLNTFDNLLEGRDVLIFYKKFKDIFELFKFYSNITHLLG